MKKYEPNYVDDEIAIQGWESAALFVQGVKMAGNNLTQANVIKEDNSLTVLHGRRADAPGQLEGRRPHRPCAAVLQRLHQGVGDKYVPALNKGKNVFILLPRPSTRRRTRCSRSRAGTPAPA